MEIHGLPPLDQLPTLTASAQALSATMVTVLTYTFFIGFLVTTPLLIHLLHRWDLATLTRKDTANRRTS